MLVPSCLVVHTHDDLVPEDVDMSLHKRHWLAEHVITCTDEVDVEYLMVPHHTEHTLVVVCGHLRVELDDNPRL